MTKYPQPLAHATLQTSNDDDEYYVFPYDGDNEAEHNGSGFCPDMTCPCHEDKEVIDTLHQAVIDGEASNDDANRIYRGKTL